ncbi:MAG: DUF3667 domain-containing protein [Pseudomonadaceae bacterium]|nr:DUF3667 domain-containing protein [Pseudomonadaceae bacterium]
MRVCKSCETTTSEDATFCSRCGARQLAHTDLGIAASFRYVLREADIPGKIGRTLLVLLVKPGELTRAYVSGATGLFVSPIRLLLAMVAVYFLVAGPYWLDYNVTHSGAQLTPGDSNPAFVDDPLAFELYKDAIVDYQSVSRLLGPLLLCWLVALIRIRTREPFGHHLVFAVHYYCFDYAWAGLMAIASATQLKLLPDFSLVSWWIPIFGGLWLYAVLAARRAYADKWWQALLMGFAVIIFDMLLTSLADGIAVGYAFAQFNDTAG